MDFSAHWFTRSEAERILTATHADVSGWQIYALPLGQQAPDGKATLYDLGDLALARLAGRMRVYLSPVVVRFVVGQLRHSLREALQSRQRLVLVLRGGGRFRRAPQGQIVAAKDAPSDVLIFPLHDLLDDTLKRAALAERKRTPDVWVGHKRLDAREVSSSLMTKVLTVA